MIYVRLKGGMGNQMFQYAYGRRLAHELKSELVMDLVSLLNRNRGADFVYRDYDLPIFQVKERFHLPPGLLRTLYRRKNGYINKGLSKLALFRKDHVKEPFFHFQPQLIEQAREGQLHEGWFQSPRYFDPIETEIRAAFRFKAPLLPQSIELAERIKRTNGICLNVRRTDFLKTPNLNATDLNYFLRSAAYLAEKVDKPHFYIFSDDVAWCQENLKLNHPTEVVNHDHKGFKFGNYLHLMTLCSHFIIPNSSFAWWAAWLSTAPEKQVVAPKQWFMDDQYNTSDLIPASWSRL